MSKPLLSPELQEVITATADTVVKALLTEQSATRHVRPRLLTVKEACVYLNCSRATLRRLEEEGVLLPKRFGRKVLYERADLDDYIHRAGVQ